VGDGCGGEGEGRGDGAVFGEDVEWRGDWFVARILDKLGGSAVALEREGGCGGVGCISNPLSMSVSAQGSVGDPDRERKTYGRSSPSSLQYHVCFTPRDALNLLNCTKVEMLYFSR